MAAKKATQAVLSKRADPSLHERIFTIRGEKVILDSDLAEIYGVETKRLNEQVRRNAARFPGDFAFRLTRDEADRIQVSRSQNATLKQGANIKYLPRVFTEHGALMAANVLNSKRAVEMSVFVVRAFTRMRSALSDTHELARKLAGNRGQVSPFFTLQVEAFMDEFEPAGDHKERGCGGGAAGSRLNIQHQVLTAVGRRFEVPKWNLKRGTRRTAMSHHHLCANPVSGVMRNLERGSDQLSCQENRREG